MLMSLSLCFGLIIGISSTTAENPGVLNKHEDIVLVKFIFDDNDKKATLEWSNNDTLDVQLTKVSDDDCIYKGSSPDVADSHLLLT